MRWFVTTKAGRILVGLTLGFGLLAFIGWMLFRPKIGHATLAEIDAVLPLELRTEPKIDEPLRRGTGPDRRR